LAANVSASSVQTCLRGKLRLEGGEGNASASEAKIWSAQILMLLQVAESEEGLQRKSVFAKSPGGELEKSTTRPKRIILLED